MLFPAVVSYQSSIKLFFAIIIIVIITLNTGVDF
jgi:hypothetical protein